MPVEAKLVLPLLSFAQKVAREIVAKGARIQPFCITMGRDGEFHWAERGAGHVDRADNVSLHVERSIVADIAADHIVAVAIGTEVAAGEDVHSHRGRAIRILIEAPGYARYFYLPFTRHKPNPWSLESTPNVEFGEELSAVTQPRYFILH